MKLSAAIKAGAKQHPQSFKHLFGSTPDHQFGTCALGAAAVGARTTVIEEEHKGGRIYRTIRVVSGCIKAFPLLREAPPETLPCGCVLAEMPGLSRPISVAGVVSHLNDDHHWRRELIAQWVKTLEDGK